MIRWLYTALVGAALLASARPAAALLVVTGSNGHSGDLVAVWVKNGFEMIVNLGPVEQLHLGTVASFDVPSQFGVDHLIGAKFTALTVPNPNAVYGSLGLDPPPPQPNIALTTNGDPNAITPVQVGDAQAALQPANQGQAWFALLNALPAPDGTVVIENSDVEALISITSFGSYTGNVGFTSDAIANTLSISTAVAIDPQAQGKPYSIPLYEVFQTLTDSGGGNFVFGTQIADLGNLTGDNGQSGLAMLSLAPEPGDAALAAGALAALAALSCARAPRGSRLRAGPSRRR